MDWYTERVKEVEDENENTSTEIEVFKANASAIFKRLGEEIIELRHKVKELEDRVQMGSQESGRKIFQDSPVARDTEKDKRRT